MKKIVLLIVLLIIPIKIQAISASSAIAYDLDNGRVLYGYNINEKRLIASTTKIMTAIIAIEKGNLEDVITVTDSIYDAFGSAIYIEVGEKITLKDLLYGLLLRSGNDAAIMISEYISGSMEEFVYLMNEYASNLKMTNTIFVNSHGLEEKNGNGNISTAIDMAKLTKYAMQNKIFREIFKTKEYKCITNYKTYLWHNKNKMLIFDYITGGKTGYTEMAKRTLVTTGSRENINIVVVTLNDPNDWKDHESIYEKVFNEYDSYKLIEKNNFKIKNESYYKDNTLYIKNDVFMTLTKEELKKVSINYNLLKIDNPINDSEVGYAEIKLEDKIYHREPIYIKISKKEKLNWWQKFKGWLYKW